MTRRWIGAGVAVLAAGLVWSGTALAEDPKAAARAIGQAGQQAAGAVARSSASADAVPGYAGTDIPERHLTAGGMPDEAARRLADPADPGGVAGRAVIDGATLRPDAEVPATDPAVVRSEGIATTPQSTAHGADGLASGGVQDCAAGLQDAQSGGACGSVRFCVGGGCETVRPQASDGFVDAAARLNMVMELGGDEFDRAALRFFRGERKACKIRFGGLADCCRNSGLLVGLGNCSPAERELAQERHDGNTHYLGEFCARRILGICVTRERRWCVFGSKLGRILQEQGRAQLGIGWGSCRGLTVAEIEAVDFDALDLSEFTADLLAAGTEPSVSLPDAGGTQTLMRDRVRDFYGRAD